MCGSNGCYECVEILTLVTLNAASGELCSSFIFSTEVLFLSLSLWSALITSFVGDSVTSLIKIHSLWKRFLCWLPILQLRVLSRCCLFFVPEVTLWKPGVHWLACCHKGSEQPTFSCDTSLCLCSKVSCTGFTNDVRSSGQHRCRHAQYFPYCDAYWLSL